MGANIAGIYGAQIFRADDRPKYRRGFSIGVAVLATGIALAIIRYLDTIIRRRKTAGRLQTSEGSSGENEEVQLSNKDIIVATVDASKLLAEKK